MANLLTIASGFTGTDPHRLADGLGAGGGRALKALVTEAVNAGLAEHRERRAEYAADPAELLRILRAGNAAASVVAERTLAEVRQVMAMDY